jgi:uncharacterized membrane protein
MRSKAAIGNHPLHPLFVTVPVGVLTLSLIGDVFHMAIPKDPFWYDLSFTCIGMGLALAVVAGIFGAIDYLGVKMSSQAFRLATWHLGLNAVAMALYAVSFLCRRQYSALTGSRWTIAFVLALAGFALLGTAGWLGGKMVYEHCVGVVEPAERPAHSERAAAS